MTSEWLIRQEDGTLAQEASMRPRPYGLGMLDQETDEAAAVVASMRPRPYGLGMTVESPCFADGIPGFNEAEAVWPRNEFPLIALAGLAYFHALRALAIVGSKST